MSRLAAARAKALTTRDAALYRLSLTFARRGSSVFEAAGGISIAIGGFVWAEPIGWFITGIECVIVGFALEADGKPGGDE